MIKSTENIINDKTYDIISDDDMEKEINTVPSLQISLDEYFNPEKMQELEDMLPNDLSVFENNQNIDEAPNSNDNDDNKETFAEYSDKQIEYAHIWSDYILTDDPNEVPDLTVDFDK